MGAQEQTFFGLTGIGDLITTCISRHSRNRNMGELIASGLPLRMRLHKSVMVAEGVETAKSAYALAQTIQHRNAHHHPGVQNAVRGKTGQGSA